MFYRNENQTTPEKNRNKGNLQEAITMNVFVAFGIVFLIFIIHTVWKFYRSNSSRTPNYERGRDTPTGLANLPVGEPNKCKEAFTK